MKPGFSTAYMPVSVYKGKDEDKESQQTVTGLALFF